ncbi:MAG: hypothetical protein KIT09_27065 [Bryobacteraceae bacterium]|nr:hypothetical protein [Bryobacteraceae bacterium]
MRVCCAALLVPLAISFTVAPVEAAELQRPAAGPVEIMPTSEIRPGMTGTAWTVFSGSDPEAVPVEIIGLWKNQWGPRQDIILAKLGGKAQRTNVAGGMSGSPVYIDGKLIGAIALRLSVFSPDAICGITPIELMLEVKDFDESVPSDALTPDKTAAREPVEIPGELLARAVSAGGASEFARRTQVMVPVETPLAFAGFHPSVLKEFGPIFQQLGFVAVQGGATAAMSDPKPAAGWENSLQPGEAVAGALVSGDMSISGLGTVTYNDGKRVLAFGHPFFNLGPVAMPMAKGEVLMVLSSAFQPNKFANATEIVGSLKQDRHSGIMGVLGEEAPMIPVTVKVRSFDKQDVVRKEKDFRFNVFVQQKWTPYLMMVTLFNSISGLNDFAEEVTYRLSGEVELHGQPNLSLATMQAGSEMPVPAPMILAGWWGDKFNRLFLNAVKTPRLKRVNATLDLLPERRVALIETAWAGLDEVDPGSEVPVKVFLQPYRGERFERDFTVKIPAGIPKGTHKILLSDADTLNRMQSAAAMASRFMDLPETVSLLNQERSNNKMYVSLVQARPTLYYEDKSLPSLPASVANVMQAGRSGSRRFVTWGESVQEQMTLPFDLVVTGNYSLNIKVR